MRELQPATFHGYYKACEEILGFFGKNRLVSDLTPQDFGSLRSHLDSRLGVVGLANAITRINVSFKWAFDNGLIERPVRYGTEFKSPSARTRRLDCASKHTRLFSAEEIRNLIKAASTVNLKAAILLGVNGGMASHDLAEIPIEAIDLDAGVIDFVRPKTGVSRRMILWDRTIKALRDVLVNRKPPKDPRHAHLMFINKFGMPYVRDLNGDDVRVVDGQIKVPGLRTDGFGQELAKLLKSLEIAKRGARFYALRHTFRTIADEVGDQRAIDLVMGHRRDKDIATTYMHMISNDRLRKVAQHVHDWLYAGQKGEDEEKEQASTETAIADETLRAAVYRSAGLLQRTSRWHLLSYTSTTGTPTITGDDPSYRAGHR